MVSRYSGGGSSSRKMNSPVVTTTESPARGLLSSVPPHVVAELHRSAYDHTTSSGTRAYPQLPTYSVTG